MSDGRSKLTAPRRHIGRHTSKPWNEDSFVVHTTGYPQNLLVGKWVCFEFIFTSRYKLQGQYIANYVYRLMLNKQCTTLPNVYCCLFAFSDFDCFWVRLDDCVKSKDENSYQMSHFAKSVLWSELLSSQFTKSLKKDRDCRGVVTNTYRFKNRPI